MDITNDRSGTPPSPGSTPSPWMRQGDASEYWSTRWRGAKGELSSLDRFEILGWDEA